MPLFTELSYRKIVVKILTPFSIGFILACSGTQTYEQIGAIEELDPAFRDLVTKDAKVEIIADGFEWSEGPLGRIRTDAAILRYS